MNSEIKIQEFCGFNSFIQEAIKKLVSISDKFGSVSIVADRDITQELFRYFISTEINIINNSITRFNFGMVNFNSVHYDKEYILTITNDLQLWCEPACKNNRYNITVESECVYVHEDCNYRVIDKIDSDDITIFGIDKLN